MSRKSTGHRRSVTGFQAARRPRRGLPQPILDAFHHQDDAERRYPVARVMPTYQAIKKHVPRERTAKTRLLHVIFTSSSV
jgi:hypothetical protein